MGICSSIPEHETINNEILETSRHEVNNERPLTAPKGATGFSVAYLTFLPRSPPSGAGKFWESRHKVPRTQAFSLPKETPVFQT